MNLFLIGFVAGIVIWLLCKMPLIAGLVIGLFMVCLMLARFRLITAFVIGLVLGFM